MSRGTSAGTFDPGRRSGLARWALAHGAVLILNAVAAAQLVMICAAGELRVLPTFGFIAVIDGAYTIAALRQRPPSGSGGLRV